MSLSARFPWLDDLSSSRQEWRGELPPPNDAGVWGIGNGQVFAHTGLIGPAGSLQGIVGPHYQTEGDHAIEGAFGACWVEVERASLPLATRSGRCGRIREAAVVVTDLDFGGPRLRIIDFAPPGLPVLIRHVACAGSFSGGDRIRVHFPKGRPVPERPRLVSAYRPGQVALVGMAAGGGEVDGGAPALAVVAEFGSLVVPVAPCRTASLSVLIATGTDPGDAERVLRATGSVAARLGETRRFWKGWLAGTTVVNSWSLRWDHPRGRSESLDDLVESAKISLKLQQSLPGGGTSPMVHFKGSWARDNNGIVRGFLASGALEEARGAIDYYVRASAHLREIPNRAPLDCPADAPQPVWSSVPVPPTEVPSWLVLQHLWWLRAGGDEELVRDHWTFLRRCLDGQPLGDQGLLPFHGDETYLHGALLSVYPQRVSWPHGLIAHTPDYPTWSLEATAAWVTAAEGMALMAQRLGRPSEASGFRARAATVRQALESAFWQEGSGWYAPARYPVTGAPHRAPFAPVNAALIWMGYRSRHPSRLRRDLEAVIREVGFGRATPDCPYDVGGTGGMLLWDLLALKSRLAPLALAHLVRGASPSGDRAEIHGPEGTPDAGYDPQHPNRLRPWETGIALEAMVRYFRERDPGNEPLLDHTLPARLDTAPRDAGRRDATPTERPRPFRRVVRVTCDVQDRDRHPEATLLEPAALDSPLEIARALFDPENGHRSVDRLEFQADALTSGRATLRPQSFWRQPAWLEALEKFVASGGKVIGLGPPDQGGV